MPDKQPDLDLLQDQILDVKFHHKDQIVHFFDTDCAAGAIRAGRKLLRKDQAQENIDCSESSLRMSKFAMMPFPWLTLEAEWALLRVM